MPNRISPFSLVSSANYHGHIFSLSYRARKFFNIFVIIIIIFLRKTTKYDKYHLANEYYHSLV